MAAVTAAVKDELSRLPAGRVCCRRAEVCAVLRFAGGLYLADGQVQATAELDNALVARRLRRQIRELFGDPAAVRLLPAGRSRPDPRYLVRVEHAVPLARATGLIDQVGRPCAGFPRQSSRAGPVTPLPFGAVRSWRTAR